MPVALDNNTGQQPLAVVFDVTDYLLGWQPDAVVGLRSVKVTPAQAVAAGFEDGIALSGSLVFSNGTLGDAFTAPAAGVVVSNGTTLAPATLVNITFGSGTLSLTNANVGAALGLTGVLVETGGTLAAAVLVGMTLTSGNTITSLGLLAANNLSDVASPGLSRKNINQGEVTLSAAASSIATDASLGNVFKTTLITGTGPYTLANPTNLVAGASYIWRITQPAGGSAQVLNYGSVFKFATPYSNASTPPLTATLGAVDILSGVSDGTNVYCQLTNLFS